MKIIYNVLFIYAIAFAIGMFVAAIIWVLKKTLTGDKFQRIIHREGYHEMKRMKRLKRKEI
jgi:hypothetical protein